MQALEKAQMFYFNQSHISWGWTHVFQYMGLAAGHMQYYVGFFSFN